MTRFDEVYQKLFNPLFRYALKFVDQQEDALNIVQDVFTVVYEKEIYNRSDEYLKSYLFQAVRNHCLNYLKRLKSRTKYENITAIEMKEMEIAYYSSGEKSLIELETFQELHNSIHQLDENYKEVILLSRFEGMKNREIADRLKLPLRTVETRLFRALAQLREKLSKRRLFILLALSNLRFLKNGVIVNGIPCVKKRRATAP